MAMPSPWYEADPRKFASNPKRILPAVMDRIFKVGYAHLQTPVGVPTELPLTPESPETHLENESVYGMAQLMRSISSELGNPYMNPKMKQANYFVQQIFPVRGRENSNSAASSNKALEMHSEHAMFETAPDFLIIGCLKNPSAAVTWIAALHPRELNAKTRVVLQKAFGSADLRAAGAPVLCQNEARLRYDPIFMRFRGRKEIEAFAELELVLQRQRKGIHLKPGDVLVLDNRRCVHGRESFRAHYDGHDRWMMRTMVVAKSLKGSFYE